MAQPNNDEIVVAWRALANCSGVKGWRSIPISLEGNCQLQAARHFPDNVEALLIGFTSIILPVTSKLPQAQGFNVERITIGASDRWLALVKHPHGSLELFSRMVVDIADTLAKHAESSELHLYQLFIGRIHAWQAFMKKGHDTLSPSSELGLVGELRFLEVLLDAELPFYLAVDAWKGPIHGLHDFELGTGAIEVKSTLASCGFAASIMSLEQLDDSLRHPLFVCGCRFSIAAGGLTLPQRVSALRERLAIDSLALIRFNNVLLYAGYLDSHSEYYVRIFLNAGISFLQVDSTFPRLVPGNVPSGIRQVRYEIDLDGLIDHQVPITEITIETGVLPNGIN
jgi:hypothetical protein